MIRALHHMAFRCRDSEETRAFYEDVIGLEFVAALPIEQSKTGRPVGALHTFFKMGEGAFIAFFEVPDAPFEFKPQHDFDLHIALEADAADLDRALARAKNSGAEVRGPSDHAFIRSVYLRDPNGYVVELAEKGIDHDQLLAREAGRARESLRAWRASNAAVRTAI